MSRQTVQEKHTKYTQKFKVHTRRFFPFQPEQFQQTVLRE